MQVNQDHNILHRFALVQLNGSEQMDQNRKTLHKQLPLSAVTLSLAFADAFCFVFCDLRLHFVGRYIHTAICG